MEKYRVLKKVGSGSFAKVYLAEDRASGRQVALKVMSKKLLTGKIRERLFREIDNMELLQHDGIAQYYESFETQSNVYIAMEYVPGGELFNYVSENGCLPETKAREIFAVLASALAHCHKNGVAHRDLKLENILMTEDEKPKIIDFGLSKEIHQESVLATYCGSPLYASPEMILNKPYKGSECDIWSLGVVLYCMLTASMPFDDSDWHDFVYSIKRGAYPKPDVSENAQHLISIMLDPYAKTRATIEDVLSHPWMNPLPRKSSLQLPPTMNKERRQAISYSHSFSLQIRARLIQECIEKCLCNCHCITTSDKLTHCDECRPVVDLISSSSMGNPMRKGSLSVSSSGYSSMECLTQLQQYSFLSSTHTSTTNLMHDDSVFT